jgi:hypothetical protein
LCATTTLLRDRGISFHVLVTPLTLFYTTRCSVGGKMTENAHVGIYALPSAQMERVAFHHALLLICGQ